MNLFAELFSPDFLFRNTVWVSLLIGSIAPLAGVFLVLRRMAFLGVALPQISACGIALAFSLEAWGFWDWVKPHSEGDERTLAFFTSMALTVTAVFVLALLERRGRGMVEARLGAVYVIAGAASLLLLSRNPHGERGLIELLKGEIIAVRDIDLWLTAGALIGVLILLVLFHKEIMLVSYDRELAVVLRKNVGLWDGLLYLLIALTIAVSVLSAGPLVAFAFILLPPLIAHHLARNLLQWLVLSSLIGGISALAGFVVAYQLDLPVGPTDVALLGTLYLLVLAGHRLVRRLRRQT
jgi:ABC-type Mn2+/Zn2+ transport system permease subunit